MIARAQTSTEYPANFMLIAAMNPCPCGYQGNQRCRCTPDKIHRYRDKISGPLLDRIDLQVNVPQVPREQLTGADKTNAPIPESSAVIASRVENARITQLQRQGCTNAQLSTAQVNQVCELGQSQIKLMSTALERLELSARAYHRVLKVARTIADLDQTRALEEHHLSEALGYRLL